MKYSWFGLLLLFCTGLNAMDDKKNDASQYAEAIFAGGCFWCMEKPFDVLPGVIKTTSGYCGGHTENPTYEQVTHGNTGHKEAIKITYDPSKVSYDKLLEIFWVNVDPTDDGGQFCDRGDSYRTAIFYTTEEQRVIAEKSKQALLDSKKFDKIVTPIIPATTFTDAEDYHQDFYQRNPVRYKYYRWNCGRDNRLYELWHDDKDS